MSIHLPRKYFLCRQRNAALGVNGLEKEDSIWTNIRNGLKNVVSQFENKVVADNGNREIRPSHSQLVKNKRSAYRLLEINFDATMNQIRISYWALIRKYYPMVNHEDNRKADAARRIIDALTEAFEILEREHVN